MCLQVAKIKEIVQVSSDIDNIMLTVAWYYRPEEVTGGRRVGLVVWGSFHLLDGTEEAQCGGVAVACCAPS